MTTEAMTDARLIPREAQQGLSDSELVKCQTLLPSLSIGLILVLWHQCLIDGSIVAELV